MTNTQFVTRKDNAPGIASPFFCARDVDRVGSPVSVRSNLHV